MLLTFAQAFACTTASACYAQAQAEAATSPVAALLDDDSACEAGAVRGCLDADTGWAELDGTARAQLRDLCTTDPRACTRVDAPDDTTLDDACRRGSARACRLAAVRLLDHPSAGHDPAAVSLLDQACTGGSSVACRRLAAMYGHGLHVTADPDAATRYAKAACKTLGDVKCDGARVGSTTPPATLRPSAGGWLPASPADFDDAYCAEAFEVDSTGRATRTVLYDCDSVWAHELTDNASETRFDVPDETADHSYALTYHWFHI